jgi:hypothetical protein
VYSRYGPKNARNTWRYGRKIARNTWRYARNWKIVRKIWRYGFYYKEEFPYRIIYK